MAITRATGKAFRLSFSWIMKLAGFQPTPAEEMVDTINAEREEGAKAAQEVAERKLSDHLKRSIASVKDKTLEVIEGEVGGAKVIFFCASQALAILLDAGLKDVTTWDDRRKMRWMLDDPEPIGILNKICKELEITLKRVVTKGVPA